MSATWLVVHMMASAAVRNPEVQTQRLSYMLPPVEALHIDTLPPHLPAGIPFLGVVPTNLETPLLSRCSMLLDAFGLTEC